MNDRKRRFKEFFQSVQLFEVKGRIDKIESVQSETDREKIVLTKIVP